MTHEQISPGGRIARTSCALPLATVMQVPFATPAPAQDGTGPTDRVAGLEVGADDHVREPVILASRPRASPRSSDAGVRNPSV